MTKEEKTQIENTLLSVEFLTALRAGDHNAFATLYSHFRQPLKSFIYSLFKSDSEAEDVTQEVFMRLWERRETINLDKNIKSLIFTIAKNTVINRLNRQKVIDRHSNSERITGEYSKTPEELLIAQETELIIELAVSKMPQTRRAVYQMSVIEHLSHEEIAEQLTTTTKNVANHLSHAKKEICKILYSFLTPL